jgi:hypothetical protein
MNVRNIKVLTYVHIPADTSLSVTNTRWGATESMYNMRGKSYKVQRVELPDCITLNGYAFHPADIQPEKTEEAKKEKVIFDPQNLMTEDN